MGKILIVCWDFPPNNAIGGRRWAKIAKSLLNLGHKVSVISKYPENNTLAPWIDRETLGQISTYHLRMSVLVSWLNDYRSVLKVLKIRLAGFLLRLFYRGTIFDKTLGIETRFTALATEVIERDGIDTVFATGAPFNLLYYTAKLKARFPGIKIVCDYRDPWLGAKNYGMGNLTAGRRKEETLKQNLVMEQADVITAPNSFLLEEIKRTYTGTSSRIARFIELPHAFDPDDVKIDAPSNRAANKIKIIYAGSLYLGVDEYLKVLDRNLSFFKRNAPEAELEVSFYTDRMDMQSLFEDNSPIVKFEKPLGEAIFEKIQSADYLLIILAEHNKNYLTSKFFEFLPYRKPYLYVGPRGFVADKIMSEHMGTILEKDADLSDYLQGGAQVHFISDADINRSSFGAVTSNFLQKIGS